MTESLKNLKIGSKRLKRFDFEPVRDLRARLKKSPDLKRRMKQDMTGTLRAEGIAIDETFLRAVSDRWHAQIQEDVHSAMERVPEERKPYYRMVRDGKPLHVRAKVDPKDGTVTVTPGEESP